MKKVYMVYATRQYKTEIAAESADEAFDIANILYSLDWEEGEFEVQEVEMISSNADEYFGPDTNEERRGEV